MEPVANHFPVDGSYSSAERPSALNSTIDQDPAVVQSRDRRRGAPHGHVPGGCPRTRGGIVELRGPDTGPVIGVAAGDEDPAVRKQGRDMLASRFGRLAGSPPRVRRRVIQVDDGPAGHRRIGAAKDEHLAIGEDGRSREVAATRHGPRARPRPRGRIEDLGSRDRPAGTPPADHEDAAIGQERGREVGPCLGHVGRRAPGDRRRARRRGRSGRADCRLVRSDEIEGAGRPRARRSRRPRPRRLTWAWSGTSAAAATGAADGCGRSGRGRRRSPGRRARPCRRRRTRRGGGRARAGRSSGSPSGHRDGTLIGLDGRAHRPVGVVESGSGRPDRDPESLGDLGRGQAQVVREDEDRPLVGRQPPEAAFEPVAVVDRQRLVRAGRSVDRQDADVRVPGRASGAPPRSSR